jgi:ketosteroid isomerase-like protein
MRFSCVLVLAAACSGALATSVTAQQTPFTRVVPAADTAVARELLGRMHVWHDAIIRADTAALRDMLLPEYSLTVAPAIETEHVPKERWLANTMRYGLQEYRYEAVDVRVLGDVAVVTSRYWQRAGMPGRERSGYAVLTDVWQRQGGEWLVASRWSTRLDPRWQMTPEIAASAEVEVRALDARWAQSYADHDTTTARRIMADDFVMTSTNGGMKDRAAELRDVAGDPGSALHYFRTADVDVNVHGGTAIVTGRLEWSFDHEGRTTEVARRYTATWVRGGDLGWHMVALHVGRAPEN